jgi:hypothetical protein
VFVFMGWSTNVANNEVNAISVQLLLMGIVRSIRGHVNEMEDPVRKASVL